WIDQGERRPESPAPRIGQRGAPVGRIEQWQDERQPRDLARHRVRLQQRHRAVQIAVARYVSNAGRDLMAAAAARLEHVDRDRRTDSVDHDPRHVAMAAIMAWPAPPARPAPSADSLRTSWSLP